MAAVLVLENAETAKLIDTFCVLWCWLWEYKIWRIFRKKQFARQHWRNNGSEIRNIPEKPILEGLAQMDH